MNDKTASGRGSGMNPSPETAAVAQAAVLEPAVTERPGAVGTPSAEAYIPGDRRYALAHGIPMPDRVRGAALFADISGFTPLTEALAKELGPQRGAEELTKNLNRVFHALIAALDRFGGHVIYFCGDAITCWIDGDDGARATACGLAMQHTMQEVCEVVTPAGVRVRLAMKVAVAVGAARRFVVGDPDVQLTDVLAGRLIDALAAAEHQAGKGEVVLDESALDSLRGRVSVRELRTDADSGRRCGVLEAISETVPDAPAPATRTALPEHLVKQWLLPSVYERISAGRAEFLAELRPAYPVFVRFGGINYDDDAEAIAKLDGFIRRVQRILTTYGGNLLHLILGDKGAYLFGVFGSPVAHEDDAARAAAAALELRGLAGETAATDIQIGITYGRLRSGAYGHEMRQAFTCLGDAVNLSARLMANAAPGCILASEPVRRAAGDVFTWQDLDPIKVKGKADPVAIFALSGSKRQSRKQAASELPMVGRVAELERMAASLDEALAGQGRVFGIAAEAGMGKSRLIAEFVRAARQRDLVVATGECQSYGKNASYFVWREIWSTLLRVDASLPSQQQVQALCAELASFDPALAARAPLLSVLLELPIPDNELTASFDAKLRKASLEALLVDCLRARARAAPLVIVLEDCHWLDALSRDLLEVLARSLAGLRVLLVLAYRPSKQAGGGLGIEKLGHFCEVALSELDRDSAALLIRSKLERMAGPRAEAPAALVDLITTRAQGNPFYIEELLNFINSKGVDLADEAALRRLELPESLHSLILSRVDTLAEAPRRTLKVASVLGRVFRAPMLPGVYPQLGAFDEVREHLRILGMADLVNVDQEEDQSYLFKHVVTQEVAYESMPFGFRSMLHERVGGYIEATEPGAIDRNLDLLAHHYWHSENLAKKREYLLRAGVAAQGAYANKAAIDYFERLAPLVDESARIDVLLKLGTVLEVLGDWRHAEEVDLEALRLALTLDDGHQRATCRTAIAEVARKQGRFEEALALLGKAATEFAALQDDAGLGRVKHLLGTLAAQRGEYDAAAEHYQASLHIREALADKVGMSSVLSNLGIIAEFRTQFDVSREFHRRAIELRTEIGDRRGAGYAMNNLGMIDLLQERYDEARAWFERSALISREVGDTWMVALCHNNLGNALRGLGNYDAARAHFAESLRVYRNFDDAWAMAYLLEDVGVLAALDGDAPSAFELIGAADAIRDDKRIPRAPSLEKELEAKLTPAAHTIGAQQAAALRRFGRSLDQAAAAEKALALCEKPAGLVWTEVGAPGFRKVASGKQPQQSHL